MGSRTCGYVLDVQLRKVGMKLDRRLRISGRGKEGVQ
jgi:hypothetical protein